MLGGQSKPSAQPGASIMSSAPQSIGRYQVIRLLGEGGMGAVYLCQDPLLKRQVAVKTVREGRANSVEMLERFQRESEISARLNHPNIVTVFDVGDDAQMGPFMTMEFVDGSSLASYIQAGPVQPEAAIGLLAQGALALGAAAKAGVIHRDIKPENMLVSREGVLKLTDFGVAKEEESTSLTTTGMLVGTPTHTAPELLQGDKATPATDRYAFAVTAFQLMAHGDLPHKGATLHALMSHIVNADPELPPDMPSAAARVFLKALHQDPSRRYSTARAFLDDLADAYDVKASLTARAPDHALASMGGGMVTQDMPTPVDFAPTATSVRTARARIPHHDSGQRLVGPPSGLFRSGEGGDDLPPPAELAKQIRLGMLAPTQHTTAGRVNLPILPTVKPNSHRSLLAVVLIAAGGYAGWNYLRSRQAAARAAAPTTAQEALPGFAALTTDPPNAKVYLGGKPIGTTPMDVIAIPAKTEEIRVELKGYKTWTGKLGPNDKLPPSVKLEPQG